MAVLWAARWPVRVLLVATVSVFVLYCVLMSVNAVLLNAIFTRFTALCYLPFMTQAMNKGEEKGFAPFSEDALYRAAVRHR
jgi:hypothetical protein